MYSQEADSSELLILKGDEHTSDYKEFIMEMIAFMTCLEELTAASELGVILLATCSKEPEGLNVYYDEQKVESLLCMKATMNRQEVSQLSLMMTN